MQDISIINSSTKPTNMKICKLDRGVHGQVGQLADKFCGRECVGLGGGGVGRIGPSEGSGSGFGGGGPGEGGGGEGGFGGGGGDVHT